VVGSTYPEREVDLGLTETLADHLGMHAAQPKQRVGTDGVLGDRTAPQGAPAMREASRRLRAGQGVRRRETVN
jgi:hypothetical protein